MAKTHVRRLPVAVEAGSDYTSVFELAPAPIASPERWARAVFEGAPTAYRLALRVGWRLGLRLRLAPAGDRGAVAGWTLTPPDPRAAALTSDGPLLTARNQVDLLDGSLTWTTVVGFRNRLGRVVWTLAAPIHHLTLPWLLRRAARRIMSVEEDPHGR